MNGTAAQTMSGSTFYNLTIDNSAGVTLLTDETINNTLTLTNGILDAAANNKTVIVTNTATTAVSAGSSSAFIKGPLQWSIGTGTYVFPVGKSSSNYFPFKLVTSASSSPVVTVEAFDSDAGA